MEGYIGLDYNVVFQMMELMGITERWKKQLMLRRLKVIESSILEDQSKKLEQARQKTGK